jgi:hypothetical protein
LSTEERRERFMAAARGLPAHTVARIMGRVGTAGIDWARVPKGRMADAYAAKVWHGTPVSEAVIDALAYAERPANR